MRLLSRAVAGSHVVCTVVVASGPFKIRVPTLAVALLGGK
jgi:hypothetical protein